MKTDSLPPTRIYVRCLAAYNAGILHGAWIDADQSPDDIMAEVQAMLAASPVPNAEEWAIHDYEGFGDTRIAEYESFETISGLAMFIDENGALGRALLENYSGDLDEAQRALRGYIGTYRSLADYAEEMMEGVEIPDAVAAYIDYESMGRDFELSGDIFTIELGHEEVLIFSNH